MTIPPEELLVAQQAIARIKAYERRSRIWQYTPLVWIPISIISYLCHPDAIRIVFIVFWLVMAVVMIYNEPLEKQKYRAALTLLEQFREKYEEAALPTP